MSNWAGLSAAYDYYSKLITIQITLINSIFILKLLRLFATMGASRSRRLLFELKEIAFRWSNVLVVFFLHSLSHIKSSIVFFLFFFPIDQCFKEMSTVYVCSAVHEQHTELNCLI